MGSGSSRVTTLPYISSMNDSKGKTLRLAERVRWADVDLVGIMRFSAFTRLVELAEQELMREIGAPFSEIFSAPQFWLPRRQLQIEYFAPARIDDLLELEVFISHMGETSMVYQVDIFHENRRRVASASMVVVCVTVDTFEKMSLPDEWRERLAPFVSHKSR